MLLVSASVGPSPIHGVGCFAEERIREGQVTWEFSERFDLRIPVPELASLPRATQGFLETYGYVEMHGGQEVVVLCGDHTKYMNHSEHPNQRWDGDRQLSVAARAIEAGEELTCDYREFDLDAERKLGGR